jgi:RNA polymerase sigma factor for flagellar operon FliA
MNWEKYFLDNLPLIDRVTAFVCRTFGLIGADAEDFASEVRIKLIDDDYAVLRKFEQKASLSTYLAIVIKRHYLDQKTHERGKWRPSTLARHGGEAAILLERLISRDRHSFGEALTIVRQKYTELDSRAIEALATTIVIPRRQRASEIERTEEMPEPASGVSAEDELLTSEREIAARHTSAILNRELGRLPSEDRLIMKLRFIDVMKVSSMAKLLKIDQKQLYRRIDRIVATLKEALLAAGVAMSDIGDMLLHGADALHFDLGDPETEPQVPQ